MMGREGSIGERVGGRRDGEKSVYGKNEDESEVLRAAKQ